MTDPTHPQPTDGATDHDQDATNQGVSSTEPVEGADDASDFDSGSPGA